MGDVITALEGGAVSRAIDLLDKKRKLGLDDRNLPLLQASLELALRMHSEARHATTRQKAKSLVAAIRRNIAYVETSPPPGRWIQGISPATGERVRVWRTTAEEGRDAIPESPTKEDLVARDAKWRAELIAREEQLVQEQEDRARQQAETQAVARAAAFARAGANPSMVCPHCHMRGSVTTRRKKQKAGVSGGKATGAILTGGLSLFATGLSRKESVNAATCLNCGARWSF